MTLFMTLFFAMSVYATPENCFKIQSNGDKVMILDFKMRYYCNPKHVTIPDEIDSKKVVLLYDKAFQNKGIEYLSLGKYLVGITDNQFIGNKIKGEIRIPRSVKVIGKNAFKGNQISRVVVEAKSFSLNEMMCFIAADGRNYDKVCEDVSVTFGNDIENQPLEIEENAFADNLINSVGFSGTPLLKKNVFSNNKIDTLRFTRSYTSFFDLNRHAFTNSLADSVDVRVDHPCNDLKKFLSIEANDSCPQFLDYIYNR